MVGRLVVGMVCFGWFPCCFCNILGYVTNTYITISIRQYFHLFVCRNVSEDIAPSCSTSCYTTWKDETRKSSFTSNWTNQGINERFSIIYWWFFILFFGIIHILLQTCSKHSVVCLEMSLTCWTTCHHYFMYSDTFHIGHLLRNILKLNIVNRHQFLSTEYIEKLNFLWKLSISIWNVNHTMKFTFSLVTGTVALVFSAIGILLAGFIVTKYRPSARCMASWNVIVAFLTFFGFVIYIFLGCAANENNVVLNYPQL